MDGSRRGINRGPYRPRWTFDVAHPRGYGRGKPLGTRAARRLVMVAAAIVVLMALLVSTGCSIVAPSLGLTGWPVSKGQAYQWGCDPVRMHSQYAVRAASQPSVGWSVCDVLAHSGMPNDMHTMQTPSGWHARFIYGTMFRPRVVMLSNLNQRGWKVDYVSW